MRTVELKKKKDRERGGGGGEYRDKMEDGNPKCPSLLEQYTWEVRCRKY